MREKIAGEAVILSESCTLLCTECVIGFFTMLPLWPRANCDPTREFPLVSKGFCTLIKVVVSVRKLGDWALSGVFSPCSLQPVKQRSEM